jgi:hypothetical protein
MEKLGGPHSPEVQNRFTWNNLIQQDIDQKFIEILKINNQKFEHFTQGEIQELKNFFLRTNEIAKVTIIE